MPIFFKLLLTSTLIFFIIDYLWLSISTPRFYKPQLDHLMGDDINYAAAGVFYIFYVLAACILVIYPLFNSSYQSLGKAFLFGAVLGVAAYGTFNFTSLSIFHNYPLKVAIVDTLWGGLITGFVCFITLLISQKFYMQG